MRDEEHDSEASHSSACWAMLGVLTWVLGCPSTTPTGVEITEVRPIENPAPPSFHLEILGRGFGLDNVSVDLANKRATSGGGLRVQVVDASGNAPPQIAAIDVVIESTSKL